MFRKELYNCCQSKTEIENNKITLNNYRGWSSVYKKLYSGYLPKDKNASILELGSGYGFFLYFLREEGFRNTLGIDVSRVSIDIAKKNGIENIFCTEIYDFLIGKGKTYDLIVAIDVLEHFKKNEVFELLKNIHSALRNGGALLLQLPNGYYPFGNIYQYGDFTHETFFTPNSLQQIFRFIGFDNMLFKPCDNYLLMPHSFYQKFLWRTIQRIIRFYIKFETNQNIDILSPNFIAIAQKAEKQKQFNYF